MPLSFIIPGTPKNHLPMTEIRNKACIDATIYKNAGVVGFFLCLDAWLFYYLTILFTEVEVNSSGLISTTLTDTEVKKII